MPSEDDERVERWARAMCVNAGVDPDGRYSPHSTLWWVLYSDRARAAIVIADQEAAERGKGTDLWAEWDRVRDKAFTDAGAIYDVDRPSAALDAFVRELLTKPTQAEGGGRDG